MKKFFCKILPCILGGLVLIFAAVCAYVYFTFPISHRPKDMEKFQSKIVRSPDFVLSADQVTADIEQLITFTEDVHPLFLKGLPEYSFLTDFWEGYEIAKANLLAMCNTSTTVGELRYEVSKYLSSLNDAHSVILDMATVQLNVNWEWIDGKLYLLDENGKLTDKEVVSVGNIPIDDIIEEVNLVFPSENEIGEGYHAKLYAKSKVILQHFGINSSAGTTVEYLENNQIKQMDCTYTNFQNGMEDKRTFTKLIDNDIAYISLEDFAYSRTSFNEFEKIIDDIEQYKKAGVKNYIVDLTDNGGGYVSHTDELMNTLGVEKIPKGETFVRMSPFSQSQTGYIRSKGKGVVKASPSIRRDESLNIYTLVDEETFSDAQRFAVSLRDANATIVIGRPSRQRTNIFGNIVYFELTNSGIDGAMATSFSIRVDETKVNEPILQPDVYVNKTEDIVQAAVDYIKEHM